jgi:hypothetical protein
VGRGLHEQVYTLTSYVPDQLTYMGEQKGEIIYQRIRLHGIPTCCTDRQELDSPNREFKHLAPKRCPVPF